jgi:conjugal transfer pilus assembly protein TrbC
MLSVKFIFHCLNKNIFTFLLITNGRALLRIMKKIQMTIFMVFLVFLKTSFALDTPPEIAERWESHSSQILKPEDRQWMLEQAHNLQKIKANEDILRETSNEISTVSEPNNHAQVAEPDPSGLLVFVSFSMSEQSLKAWTRQAKKAGGTLVLRGLVENSLKKTLERVQQVLGSDNLYVLNIDPVAFKTFAITAVPAVVVTEAQQGITPEQSSEVPNFDVIYGDVGLSYALKKIAEDGEQSALARAYLEKLETKP